MKIEKSYREDWELEHWDSELPRPAIRSLASTSTSVMPAQSERNIKYTIQHDLGGRVEAISALAYKNISARFCFKVISISVVRIHNIKFLNLDILEHADLIVISQVLTVLVVATYIYT